MVAAHVQSRDNNDEHVARVTRRRSIPRPLCLKVVILVVVTGPRIVDQLVDSHAILRVFGVNDLAVSDVDSHVGHTGPPRVLEEDDVAREKLGRELPGIRDMAVPKSPPIPTPS